MLNSNHLTIDHQISPIAHDDLKRMLGQIDESDPEILRFFESEALVELKKIEDCLQAWDSQTTGFPLSVLQISFHTLKGAANSIGQLRIGALAGGMERALAILKDKPFTPGRSFFIKTCIGVMETIRLLLAEARSPGLHPANKKSLSEAVDMILELQHKLAVGLPA
jgi:chemotaxis protein histidine kinase CheA